MVPLPSKTPVSLFLDEYSDYELPKRREGSADADLLEEVVAGVREYFNKSLGRLLLYRFERPQWQEIYASINKGSGELAGKQVADVYGVEHLLRLFSTFACNMTFGVQLTHGTAALPDLIAHTNMDSQAVARLREELFKMTSFLGRHTDKYLSTEYEHTANAYIESAR